MTADAADAVRFLRAHGLHDLADGIARHGDAFLPPVEVADPDDFDGLDRDAHDTPGGES